MSSSGCQIIIAYELLKRFDEMICFQIRNIAYEKYRKDNNGFHIVGFERFYLEDEFIKITISHTKIIFEIATWNESCPIVEDVKLKSIEDENGDMTNPITAQTLMYKEIVRPYHEYIKDVSYEIKLKEFDLNDRLKVYYDFVDTCRDSVIYNVL